MSLSREVVAQHEPKPRFNLKKPQQVFVLVISVSGALLYYTSQRKDEIARASETPVAKRPEQEEHKEAEHLVALARDQEAKRAEEARRAAQALSALPRAANTAGGSAPLSTGVGAAGSALPKVSELLEGAPMPDSADGDWAPTSEPGGSTAEAAAATRRAEIVGQHRERVLQRRLQASEAAMFADSMRVDGLEHGTRRVATDSSAGPGSADSEQYPMRGLNAISDALLQQSANQVTAGAGGVATGLGALEALRGLAVPGVGAQANAAPGNDGRDAKNLAFFQRGGEQLRPGLLMASVQKAASPYELKMGTFIPGVLITQIHSESPGQILGQVSENVYDSTHLDHLLIPQGTKIVGTYSGAISIGQERVQVASVRLNFPNGDTLDLGGMSVADATGQAGLTDRLNNHLLRRAAATLLSTAATAGYEVSSPQSAYGMETAVHRALGESIVKLANDMAARDAQIPPTLEVRAGARFVIHMNKDVIFPGPYQDGYVHRRRDVIRARGRNLLPATDVPSS